LPAGGAIWHNAAVTPKVPSTIVSVAVDFINIILGWRELPCQLSADTGYRTP